MTYRPLNHARKARLPSYKHGHQPSVTAKQPYEAEVKGRGRPTSPMCAETLQSFEQTSREKATSRSAVTLGAPNNGANAAELGP